MPPWLILLSSFLLLAWAGSFFQTRILLAELPESDGATRFAFASCAAISCLVMELPVLQLLGHLAPGDATAAIWEAGLRALVVLSTVFLPALLTWKVLRPASFGPRPLILTALFVIVCNVIFWRGAAYLPGVPALREGESSVSLAQGVARMAVLGTALLAMLVGNGTVQAPYSLIGRFIRAVGDAHVQGVDTQLVNSLELIATKKKKMAALKAKAAASGDRGSSALGWLASTLGLSGSASAIGAEIELVSSEIGALERLSQELVAEAVALREDRERVREQGTLMGIAKNILGYLFALYCVFRLWIALDTAVKRQASGGDPIAAAVGAVAWLVSGGRVTVNQAALRQVVTVAFIALVLGNSLRSFVQQTLRALSFLAGSGDSSVVSLVFAEVMCFYVAASVLLILQRLPEDHRLEVERGMGGQLEMGFFNRWFNGLFFLSAVLTVASLYLSHSGKRRAAREATAFHVM